MRGRPRVCVCARECHANGSEHAIWYFVWENGTAAAGPAHCNCIYCTCWSEYCTPQCLIFYRALATHTHRLCARLVSNVRCTVSVVCVCACFTLRCDRRELRARGIINFPCPTCVCASMLLCVCVPVCVWPDVYMTQNYRLCAHTCRELRASLRADLMDMYHVVSWKLQSIYTAHTLCRVHLGGGWWWWWCAHRVASQGCKRFRGALLCTSVSVNEERENE